MGSESIFRGKMGSESIFEIQDPFIRGPYTFFM